MLLIDATNLSGGGGGALLTYFLERIADRPFRALISERTQLQPSEKIEVNSTVNPLGSKRQSLLDDAIKRHNPETVFCFGNLPPKNRLSSPRTVTYFQNAHLIRSLDRSCRYGWKDQLRYFLLRRAIRTFAPNTDGWVFQSSFIRSAFVDEYRISTDHCSVIPFFDEQNLRDLCGKIDPNVSKDGFIYLSDDRPHKNHQRLFDAWEILRTRHSLTPTLHLTIPDSNKSLCQRIDNLNASGLRIRNHGILPRARAMELTGRCEFSIFPSLLETLGLGLVEGCLLGNKIIAPNNPALAEVIMPSEVMDPLDPESIASAAANACNTTLPDARVLLEDNVGQLIELLFE